MMAASAFQGNSGYGVYAGGVITVAGCTFEDNGSYGLYTGDSTPAWVSGSTFTGNGAHPLRTGAFNLHRAMSGNTFSGNTPNRLLTWGPLEGTITFPGGTGLAGLELEDDLTVPAGMALTVEPGAAVMGQGYVELQVLGHLEAVGTSVQPITFTSATDSAPNEWTGLVFDGGTGDLRHVTVRYGGDSGNSGLPNSNHGSNIAVRGVADGEVRIESSQVVSGYRASGYTSYGLYVADSRVVVSDTVFQNNGYYNTDYALYATGASTVTVAGSTFQDNSGYGLEAPDGPIVGVSDSTFTGHGNYPLQTGAQNLHQALSGNTFTGNSPNRLLTWGSLEASVTLPGTNGLAGYELGNDLTVPAGMTLTVASGAAVMGRNNVELQVLGHLEAVGTAGQPITFTSAEDSAPRQWAGLVFDGGTGEMRHVTVRYGGQDNSLPGYTGSSIAVRGVTDGEVRIESSHVVSGYRASGYAGYGLYAADSRVVVSDTVFQDNGYYTSDHGIYVGGVSTVTLQRLAVTDNVGDGIYFAPDFTTACIPAATIINSAISSNEGYGLRNESGLWVDARGNWWGDASGPSGEGPGTGDEVSEDVEYLPWLPEPGLAFVSSMTDAGELVAWRDLSWIATGGITVAVRVGNTWPPDAHWTEWVAFTSLPADLGGLPPSRYLEWSVISTAVPSADDIVVSHGLFTHTIVGGPISGDTTWRAADSPYLVAGSNILVYQGTTLNIEPGVSVWFSDTRAMQVDGTLLALGTDAQPITFTSWHPQGQKDDWGSIAFSALAQDASFDGDGNYLSGSALQHVTVEYGGAGIVEYAVDGPNTAVYADHCTIRTNGAGGLRVGGGDNYLTDNTVSANDGAGIHSTSSVAVISNNTVVQNVASSSGGGIYNSGNGAITHNTVISNATSQDGGGIYNSGAAMVSDNTVIGNQAATGGGIYNDGGETVSHNTVTGNRASSKGGGIYSSSGNDTTVSHNTIVGNQVYSPGSTAHGGGIYCQNCAVSHNTVTSNIAHAWTAAYGGGIYSSGPCTISNNIVTDNQAYYSGSSPSYQAMGGGIYGVSGGIVENNEVRSNSVSGANAYAGGVYCSDGSLHGNTILSNTAQGNAGGVYWVSSGSEVLHNTIVSNTTPGNTGGVYVLSGYAAINHNDISGNSGYALFNNNPKPADDRRLDARYNWWGTTDENGIRGLIYDWFDDLNVGFVDFSPYLFGQPNLSPAGVNLSGPAAGLVSTLYSFDASVYPIAAVKPISYVWQATDQSPVTHTLDTLYDTTGFTWLITGTKRITLTASNREGAAVVTHTISIASPATADAFEVDDTCPQARDIATDGSTQLRTFHTTENVDWVTFEAVAGTTYVIEATTPVGSSADVSLELYDACDGAKQDGQDPVFSPDVSLTFDAPANTPLYLRLEDVGAVIGDEGAAYYLSVRALSQAADPGAVVLVAGKRKNNDPLQPNIYNVTNDVYRLFLANGYTSERIYYLAADTGLDADGDGMSDVDALSTKGHLEEAITQWGASRVDENHPFTLYLMDHGAYDLFYLNLLSGAPETVTPLELTGWLDQLEAAAPGVKVNVILEACHSGSFINESPQMLSKPGRVVVASTGAYPVAYASQNGAMFSDAFVAALGRGMSLNSSFAEARWTLQQAHPDQTPWLDDNGNGIPNEVEDGREAAKRGFAYAGTFSDLQWPPYILEALVRQADGIIKAQVQAQEGNAVSTTWALVYSPSYEPPPPGEDMVRDEDDPNVDKVALQDPDEDGIYIAFHGFVEPGTYRVVIYAIDDRGLSARPREADYEVVNHAPVTPFSPVPADRASNVPITQLLSWQGSDIDGDPVTYTVAFGTASPPPVVAPVVTTTTYDPGLLVLDTTYYWGITATDGLSVSVGGMWQFTTAPAATGDFWVYLPLVVRND